MARKVYLHIGAPKTGTTYVQDRLVANRESLASFEVTLPTKSKLVMPQVFWFRAALDVLEQDWGGAPGHAAGAWDTLLRRIERGSKHVIVSHEIFAPAKPHKLARIMGDLSAHEVHVVYSARDVARQVPAAWQESIKQGRRWSLKKFTQRFIDKETFFAKAMDLPTVLDAWGEYVPAERLHLVTVPAVGTAPKEELWRRMCQALALNPIWAPEDTPRANPSLGAAEVAVLRDLNRALGRSTRKDAAYDLLILQALAQTELAERAAPLPVTLDPAHSGWAHETGARWVEYAQNAGLSVHGTLSDLIPAPAEGDWLNPDRIAPKRRYRPAIAALAAMTHEAAGRPDPKRQLGNLMKVGTERLLGR